MLTPRLEDSERVVDSSKITGAVAEENLILAIVERIVWVFPSYSLD
jgi:hypothetical protein